MQGNAELDDDPLKDVKESKAQKEIKELELELVPFVIKIQRTFRLVKFVYKKFGPMLFWDSREQSSYGQIKFREVFEPAEWIRVRPESSARRLVKLMDYYWKLPKPEGQPF